MGIALENPNDRRRINLLTRAVTKGSMTAQQAVDTYYNLLGQAAGNKKAGITIDASNSARHAFKKLAGLQTASKADFEAAGGPAAFYAQNAKGPKISAKERDQARRKVVKALQAREGYGTGYASRALASHESRYLSNKKKGLARSKGSAYGPSKTLMVFGRPYIGVDHDAAERYASERKTRREKSGKTGPDGKLRQGAEALMRSSIRTWVKGTGTGKRGGKVGTGGFKSIPKELRGPVTPYPDAFALAYGSDAAARLAAANAKREATYQKALAGGFRKRKADGSASAAASAPKTQTGRSAAQIAATQRMIEANKAKRAAKAAQQAASNPGMFGGMFGGDMHGDGMFGGIALENPTMFGAVPVLKYGAIAGAGAAAGLYVHYKAVPWVSANVYTKIPVVGQYLVQYNYAATGLLAGTVLAGVAARLEGNARTAGALLATGVFAAGGMLQLAKHLGLLNEEGEVEAPSLELTEEEVVAADPSADLSGMFGGIALENGQLHGIAMENAGMFGGLGYGDGMAYQVAGLREGSPFDVASLAAPGFSGFDQGVSDYAGASPADALYSGADLDMEEGQAACAGQAAYQAKFGHPPVRISAMGGQVTHSHLAGRQGHRWGWLIKMVGFNRFRQIAALPPAQRLAILRKMRAAALAAYKQELSAPAQLPSAEVSPTDVSGTTAVMSGAASGADSSYGAMLFAGPDYLR